MLYNIIYTFVYYIYRYLLVRNYLGKRKDAMRKEDAMRAWTVRKKAKQEREEEIDRGNKEIIFFFFERARAWAGKRDRGEERERTPSKQAGTMQSPM